MHCIIESWFYIFLLLCLFCSVNSFILTVLHLALGAKGHESAKKQASSMVLLFAMVAISILSLPKGQFIIPRKLKDSKIQIPSALASYIRDLILYGESAPSS